MSKSGIYKITNTLRNRVYVGSARNAENRIKEHIRHLNKGTHANPPLQRAWKKHGADAFVFEILELCERPVLRQREQYWLDLLKAGTRQFGYNIASPMRQEAPSEKMSALHKAHWAKLEKSVVKDRVAPMHKALIEKREEGTLREDLRAKALARWQDPKRRAVYMNGHEKYWGNPENKAAQGEIRSANAKAAWEMDSERKIKLKARRAEQNLDSNYIQGMKDSTSSLWKDPEYRDKVTTKVKQSCNDPEYKRKLSERVKAYWAAKKAKEAPENP